MLHFCLVLYKEKDHPVKLDSRPKLLVGIINSQYSVSILSLLVPQGKILANLKVVIKTTPLLSLSYTVKINCLIRWRQWEQSTQMVM